MSASYRFAQMVRAYNVMGISDPNKLQEKTLSVSRVQQHIMKQRRTHSADIWGPYFKREMDTKGCSVKTRLMFSITPSLLSVGSINHIVAVLAWTGCDQELELTLGRWVLCRVPTGDSNWGSQQHPPAAEI